MQKFKQHVSNIVSKQLKIKKAEVFSLIEIPPEESLGDLSLPCFNFSKTLKKSPNEIAENLLLKLKPDIYIRKIEIKGPYLNFFLQPKTIAKLTLKEIGKREVEENE